MKIRFFGAAGGEVTGSAYLVQTREAAIMVDAGMFQGGRQSEAKNKLPQGARPDRIDAILLTHGHLDHTGRVPLLIKYGYNHPIYATEETLDLSQIILQDSARLQVADAIRQNRKGFRKGMKPAEPLYNTEHVEYMQELGRPVKLHEPVSVAKGITARWMEAGHMLGSGSIELTVNEDGKKKVVVFSGDLGPIDFPMLNPFEQFSKADLVIMESTYGDRDHRSYEDTLAEFETIIRDVVQARAKVLVPSFAIGRSQQIIYHMAELFHKGVVPKFPVYLDSPMAIRAYAVYRENQNALDEEFQRLKKAGVFPLDPSVFISSATAETSKALNEVDGPCMILAGAGMCNGGRILHHLVHNLENPNAHVMIVGFQSYGSIGRRLVEKVPYIRIFGEELEVKAKIHTLGGFSAHAGQSDLMKWFSTLGPAKPKVVLTHGEDVPRTALASLINKQWKIKPVLPKIGDVLEL